MQETKDTKDAKVNEISGEQAADVSGGAECSPGVTITVAPGTQITGPSVAQVYDDIVDGASHIIETVANATKAR
ncbi:MAG TPA: hypothetical protein VLT89_17430 [Usitatibacter sp.]|nr:hypothetical protein [Usitatibacter sp.]